MHRCLETKDILREIAEFLCIEQVNEALCAVARLARCCKLMEGPIMDVIWARRQTSFVTLLKCFPPHLLELKLAWRFPKKTEAFVSLNFQQR